MVEGLTLFSSPTKGSCQQGPEDFTASARLTVAPRQTSSSNTDLLRPPGDAGGSDHIFTTTDARDPGDSSGEATPVPISNTEVKLSSAEDTQGAAPWENRSSPGSFALSRAAR